MNPPDLNPILAFQQCYEAACQAGQPEPTAMTLATVKDQKPSLRTVLFKHVDQDGWVFYTNSSSRKGQELAQNPHVALSFYWPTIEVQIRAEGRAIIQDPKSSDAYFASRPRISQLGAWASKQSQVIPSREFLLESLQEVEKRFEQEPVTRPPHWNGYRVEPQSVELWFMGDYRLHDRFLYTLTPERTWKRVRLSP